MARPSPRFRVDEIAVHQGLNIHQLSQMARVSYSSVHKIWNNEARDVTVSTLNKLAEALDVNLVDLFAKDEGTGNGSGGQLINNSIPLQLAA
jgi:DNA-binding Xre family transcriptional regulator